MDASWSLRSPNKCKSSMLCKLERKVYFKNFHAVTDETWFYEKPLGYAVTRRFWVSAEGDVTPIKIATRTQWAKKFQVLMAITFGRMFHSKRMEQGVSITSKEYTNFLTETINKFNLFSLPQKRRSIPREHLPLQRYTPCFSDDNWIPPKSSCYSHKVKSLLIRP